MPFNVFIFTKKNNRYFYITELNYFIEVENEFEYEDGQYFWEEAEIERAIKNEKKILQEEVKSIISRNKDFFRADVNQAERIFPVYTLCMHPSRKCNLRCKYCYANESDYLTYDEISLEMAEKAIDFLIEDYGKKAIKYSIDMAGSGEPLMRFDFIKQVSEYCAKKSNEIHKDIYIMFPTNATLITNEIAEFLNNTSNILLGVSLDGNKEQSQNRVFKNGTDSFNKAQEGIQRLEKSFGIAVTITHINEDVDELYDYLYNTYPLADAISMQQVRDFSEKSEMSFYNINLENMIQHYSKLNEKLIDKFLQGEKAYVFKLLRGADYYGKIILRLLNACTIYNKRCAAGVFNMSVDHRGNLYSCSVENGNIDFKIGDIFKGVEKNIRKFYEDINVNTIEKCNMCWIRNICGGECHVKSYLVHGNMYEPVEEICYLKRELTKLAIQFIAEIKKRDMRAYTDLRLFHVDNTIEDTSLWVLCKYFELRNIDVSFNILNVELIRKRGGVSPLNVISLAKKYGVEFKLYEINDCKKIEKEKFPIIAFQNFYKKGYRYILIEEISNNSVVFDDIFLGEHNSVSKDYFLNNISNIFLVRVE